MVFNFINLKSAKGFRVGLLILFFLFNGLSSFARENSGNTIKSQNEVLNWNNSIEEGIKQAKKEDKLVLVDFCANWCDECKELDKHTYSNKNVISEIKNNFVNIRIDISKENNAAEIIRKYDIIGIPAIIFFNREAKLISDYRITGFTKPDDFIKVLKAVKNYEKYN